MASNFSPGDDLEHPSFPFLLPSCWDYRSAENSDLELQACHVRIYQLEPHFPLSSETRQSLFNFCFQTTLLDIYPGFIFLATEHLLVIHRGGLVSMLLCDERENAVMGGGHA